MNRRPDDGVLCHPVVYAVGGGGGTLATWGVRS